jgi:hypothetical protein
MSGLKENGISNSEVLAAVNKIHNQKSRTLKIFPQVSRLLQKFYYTLLIFKVELKQGNQGGRIQDLDVPRKVQPSRKKL